MKKRWLNVAEWILGCVVVIAAIVLMTYAEHHAGEGYQARCQEDQMAVTGRPRDGKGTDERCQYSDRYLPWWYPLVSWPAGITTWAVLATGGFIAWQSHETRVSAKATASSVILANKVFQVQRSKDRPRVSITIDDVDLTITKPTVAFSVTYECPTNAWIKSVYRTATIRPKGSFPKSDFVEQHLRSLLTDKNEQKALVHFHVEPYTVLINGKTGSFRLSESSLDQFNAGEIDIVLAVRILFEDVYGWRDYFSTKVCQASPLRGFDGKTTIYWSDGPEDLNWDRQQD